jgi:uncharacterized membrane protein (Fun14 family)
MVSTTTATKPYNEDKTEKLGITLPILLLQKIDNNRGDISRSKYIRRVIENYLKSKGSESKVAIDVGANTFSPFLTTVGFGGMVGFLIGFAIKEIMKILAVGAGIFFTALMYLESQNIMNINWDKLQSAISTLTNAAGQIPLASTTSSTAINFAVPMTGSSAIGFAIGFMRA